LWECGTSVQRSGGDHPGLSYAFRIRTEVPLNGGENTVVLWKWTAEN